MNKYTGSLYTICSMNYGRYVCLTSCAGLYIGYPRIELIKHNPKFHNVHSSEWNSIHYKIITIYRPTIYKIEYTFI